jgi:murein DD-endopeptidase MepM/ murein hydrolase activator NlpD
MPVRKLRILRVAAGRIFRLPDTAAKGEAIHLKAWKDAILRFFAKRGFYALTALCLILVAGAAVYARGRIVSPRAEAGRAPAAPAAAVATVRPDEAGVPALAAPAPTPAPLAWPVTGREILRGYSAAPVWFEPLGLFETHSGVDISAPAGEAVLAAADGVVSFAGFDPQRGYMVEAQGEGGLVVRYGNLSKPLTVSPGDRLRRGQPVGSVGTSAPSEGVLGPFLHFEAFRGGSWVALG